MASPRYTIEDSLATILQINSQRAAAKYIGVNSRTLERWLSGEKTPTHPSQQKIRAAAGKVRRQLIAKAKKSNYSPIVAPVPVFGERRLLKEYNRRGEFTGHYYPSDWTNYRVDRLTFDQALAVLIEIQKFKTLVQFIFYDLWGITTDGERYGMPEDADLSERSKLERSGSTHFDIEGLSKIRLSNLLKKFYHGNYRPGRTNLIYIAAFN